MLWEFLGAFIGGAAAVLGGVAWLTFRFLPKTFSDLIVERVRRDHAEQLEGIKHELAIVKDRSTRFDASQFEMYATLWSALHDLKRAADRLWETASVGNLADFGKRLVAAEETLGRKRLLVEEADAQDLDRLIDVFWSYRIGKKRLIELRSRGGR